MKDVRRTTRRYIPENRTFHNHSCRHLKSCRNNNNVSHGFLFGLAESDLKNINMTDLNPGISVQNIVFLKLFWIWPY
jgi:hypothetical protein